MIVEAPLLELVDRAKDDADAAAVLLDALLERPRSWRDERVLMLCLGVPLDPRPPARLGHTGRANWRQQRCESIAFAKRQWELYSGRNDFARAVIALILFGGWRTRGTSGSSPWHVARRADLDYQASLAGRRANAARRRERLATQTGSEGR